MQTERRELGAIGVAILLAACVDPSRQADDGADVTTEIGEDQSELVTQQPGPKSAPRPVRDDSRGFDGARAVDSGPGLKNAPRPDTDPVPLQDRAGLFLPGRLEFINPNGILRTLSTQGRIDLLNPFFSVLGENGRSCASCHLARDAWSLTPLSTQVLFELTGGTASLFRPVDGANTPLAPVGSVAERRAAYSMLLKRAVIRIGLPMPAAAEFDLIGVDDPYGFASARELSLFRRIPASANLRFLPAVMWDGRETFPGSTMADNLGRQANSATRGHAQGTRDLTALETKQIVDFELSLIVAQSWDRVAGRLNAHGGRGGPEPLVSLPFYLGINDTFGGDPMGRPFNPIVMTTFDGWRSPPPRDAGSAARASAARGQILFNTKEFVISGVKGINDDFGRPSFLGTCTTCHNAPEVGGKSRPPPQDIGVSDASRRTPDMPLYVLRHKSTGEIIRTTDPGRGLITGAWKDVNRFKTPMLRALAARPPYFHDGSASTLLDVVEFYETRFKIGLTAAQKRDLAAFMRML